MSFIKEAARSALSLISGRDLPVPRDPRFDTWRDNKPFNYESGLGEASLRNAFLKGDVCDGSKMQVDQGRGLEKLLYKKPKILEDGTIGHIFAKILPNGVLENVVVKNVVSWQVEKQPRVIKTSKI